MRVRLTDEFIKRAKRPALGQQLLWDDLVSGFGVRLTPKATSFVVQYRKDGKKPRTSLGRWPQVPCQQARELARKRLLQELGTSGALQARELRVVLREWFARKVQNDRGVRAPGKSSMRWSSIMLKETCPVDALS